MHAIKNHLIEKDELEFNVPSLGLDFGQDPIYFIVWQNIFTDHEIEKKTFSLSGTFRDKFK